MDNPGFYAILPASVRYDNRLKAAEKILFCEITALSDQNGYCHAQNGYFSQLYQVDERTIRRWIHQLEKLGYIHIECEKTGDTQQRRIIPGGMPVQDGHTVSAPDKNVRPPRTEMSGTPGQNCPPEQYKNNNTRYNNIGDGLNVLDEFAGDDEKLHDALHAFFDNRKETKKPMTRRACVALCTTLSKMADDAKIMDRSGYMIAALDQAILNGWQGVWEPKNFVDKATTTHSSGGAAPAPRQIGPDEDISKYF